MTIFRTGDGDRVVSVERLPESGEEDAGSDDSGAGGEAPAVSGET
ncbi:MAG: hypothetical protein WDN06_18730 [Asticcacaulis sp.]